MNEAHARGRRGGLVTVLVPLALLAGSSALHASPPEPNGSIVYEVRIDGRRPDPRAAWRPGDPQPFHVASPPGRSAAPVRGRGDTPSIEHVADVVPWLAFLLPQELRPGAGVRVDQSFEGTTAPDGSLRVRGESSFEPAPDAASPLRLVGRFDVVPLRRAPGVTLAGARATFTSLVDASERRVLEVTFRLDVARFDGSTPRASSYTGEMRPVPDVPPDGPDMRQAIDRSVLRAVGFLRRWVHGALAMRASSRDNVPLRLGNLALAALALLRAGVAPDDPQIDRAFRAMDALELNQTYDVSLFIQAIEARYDRPVAPEPGSSPTGTRRRENGGPAAAITPADRRRVQAAATWLVHTRIAGGGAWSYSGGMSGGDHSNTQFAVLGLHAARRCGVAVPSEVFVRIAEQFVLHQQPDGPVVALDVGLAPGGTGVGMEPDGGRSPSSGSGAPEDPHATRRREPPPALGPGSMLRPGPARARGWTYAAGALGDAVDAYGSMSAAGVSSLAVSREVILAEGADPRALARVDEALRDGVAWLHGGNWRGMAGVAALSLDPGCYALYSLAKACELARIDRLGAHDWYAEGAWSLMASQQPQGSFGVGSDSDTSLALLFLCGATARREPRPPGAPEPDERPDAGRVATGAGSSGRFDAVHVPGAGVVSLLELLAALDSPLDPEHTAHVRLFRRAFERMDAALRPRLVPGLVRLLASPHRDVRRAAEEALPEATGLAGAQPEEMLRWYRRFERARLAGETSRFDEIPCLILLVRDGRESVPLRTACVRALARLRAVEAAFDLLDALESFAYPALRAEIASALALLTGRAPEPATSQEEELQAARESWRRILDERFADLMLAETCRRLCLALGHDPAAEQRLTEIGPPAVPALEAALADPARRERAVAVLERVRAGEGNGRAGGK